MRNVTVAATQMACSWDTQANIARADTLVRAAASEGAQIILLQELFETPYFCIEQHNAHLALASPRDNNALLQGMQALAAELEVVLPVSWYEQEGQCYFNSIAIIDADGSLLGVYRKSHIPNCIGYQEKSYFSPGDSGLDSRDHWRRVMQGHAAANVMPVIASNRIGHEVAKYTPDLDMTFYGNSFIADYTGEVVAQADDHSETVLVHSFDLDEVRSYRHEWGLFRDRRPDLYGDIGQYTPGTTTR